MKNTLKALPLLALVVLLASCSGTQQTTAYDDIYYNPKEVIDVSSTAYVDIDERETAGSTDEYPKGRAIEEYYDPDQKNSGYDPDLNYDDYRERYNQDEYYYSSRFRRFHQPYYSFGYYDPFYSNSNWYSYDPYFWSPRVVRPYYYSPGWGFNWNSQFGWTASYTSGWYNMYPFSGYYGVYGGYGYNPYSYYGNSFCPQYGNGFGYNDYYYNSTPIFNGQYNSLNSYSSSSSTRLGKMLPPNEPMYEIQYYSRQDRDARPQDRPEFDYARPADTSRPVETRPSELERPADRPFENTRPREDYRPIENRPIETRPRDTKPRQTRPIEQPRQNRSVDPPRNDRGGGFSSPSRTTPPRSTGSSKGGTGRRN